MKYLLFPMYTRSVACFAFALTPLNIKRLLGHIHIAQDLLLQDSTFQEVIYSSRELGFPLDVWPQGYHETGWSLDYVEGFSENKLSFGTSNWVCELADDWIERHRVLATVASACAMEGGMRWHVGTLRRVRGRTESTDYFSAGICTEALEFLRREYGTSNS